MVLTQKKPLDTLKIVNVPSRAEKHVFYSESGAFALFMKKSPSFEGRMAVFCLNEDKKLGR